MALYEALWAQITSSEKLKRSSHVLSVVENKAFVFGGELLPRQPRDNHCYSVDLHTNVSEREIEVLEANDEAPSPRVGSASASVGQNVYIFSGRGGDAMTPIEETGALWQLDTSTGRWRLVSPADASKPYPAGRSYHCMTTDGQNTIYLHAGCPAQGRISDLWSFNLSDRAWTMLADAPAPARGGTSVAFLDGLLYRMNGFDGNAEQGGSVDVCDLKANTWTSHTFTADGVAGPVPRSVSTLLAVSVNRRPVLVTLFGERDPSSLGHQGAGKMLSDIWIYDIQDSSWREATVADKNNAPCARGWFDADVVRGSQGDKILVLGGLGESNERLSDAWLLSLRFRIQS